MLSSPMLPTHPGRDDKRRPRGKDGVDGKPGILDVYFKSKVQRVLRSSDGKTVTGIIVDVRGKKFQCNSKVLIDATEYGDLLPWQVQVIGLVAM